MKTRITTVVCAMIFTLLVGPFGSQAVHACPYPDPTDPRNAECAPATTVAPSSTSTTVAPAPVSVVSTTSTAPSSTSSTTTAATLTTSTVVPGGDVPGRSVSCSTAQYPDRASTITCPPILPATGSGVLRVLGWAAALVVIGGLISFCVQWLRSGRSDV